MTRTERKIVPRATVAAHLVDAPRPIVFSNGVFDLLHVGHVTVLEAAKAMGATLVVGVNTDASARRLGKGPGRPVQATADRMRMIAALEAVDWVVSFDEDTPEQLLEVIAPDVLVKGGDYDPDRLPGAHEVRARGGTVCTIPLHPEASTTRLMEVIRATTG